MKKTGIFRRIDELGRIVIPKEIRRMLSIKDGENLEILVDGETIILKKYHQLSTNQELSDKLINIYKNISENNIIITDTEKVIACSCTKNLVGRMIDLNLQQLIQFRESVISENKTYVFETESISGCITVSPIITESDCIGLVIIFSEQPNCVPDEIKIAKIIAKIIAEKLNIG